MTQRIADLMMASLTCAVPGFRTFEVRDYTPRSSSRSDKAWRTPRKGAPAFSVPGATGAKIGPEAELVERANEISRG